MFVAIFGHLLFYFMPHNRLVNEFYDGVALQVSHSNKLNAAFYIPKFMN